MFSLLSTRAGAGVLKYIRLSEVSATFTSSDYHSRNNNECSKVESQKPAQTVQSHPLHKRDLINFPRPNRLERNPPVRFGFIPKGWFDFFYKKTGVTGGYMLMFGGLVVLFSKEIIVINVETLQGVAYISLCTAIQKLYGPSIYNYIDKQQEKQELEIDSVQENEINRVKNNIKELEKNLWRAEGVGTFLAEAKRENVYLQMEIEYRERLKAQYTAVKNFLDFHVEKSNIERLALQKILFSWVVNRVHQSLTPEIKQRVLRKSIEDLNALARRSTN